MSLTQLTYEQIQALEIQASAARRNTNSLPIGKAWNAIGTPDNVLALIQEIKRLREESYQVVSESLMYHLALDKAEYKKSCMETREANAQILMEKIVTHPDIEEEAAIRTLALSALRCLRGETPSGA
ncbi:hypothetical protein [Enterobacillus tribolii]|uniref:Uncharacterized protein n=1 Tax=Enterobacillus tribolii TaxID=1487935 RepID=A0A370R4X6_9GAMM|nr:hypothetical protein [Enterobacillus tribolii]MBW7983421.1 hypothetical protein [Enterobacillus tribolii]RDK97481.1 hypothetical protein C8D90_101931 [Enterobacillus tribolii]